MSEKEKVTPPYNKENVKLLEDNIGYDPDTGSLVVSDGAFEAYLGNIKDNDITVSDVRKTHEIVRQFTIDTAYATGKTGINVMKDHKEVEQLDAKWNVVPGLNVTHSVLRNYTDNKGNEHHGRVDTKVEHTFGDAPFTSIRNELYDLGSKKIK